MRQSSALVKRVTRPFVIDFTNVARDCTSALSTCAHSLACSTMTWAGHVGHLVNHRNAWHMLIKTRSYLFTAINDHFDQLRRKTVSRISHQSKTIQHSATGCQRPLRCISLVTRPLSIISSRSLQGWTSEKETELIDKAVEFEFYECSSSTRLT